MESTSPAVNGHNNLETGSDEAQDDGDLPSTEDGDSLAEPDDVPPLPYRIGYAQRQFSASTPTIILSPPPTPSPSSLSATHLPRDRPERQPFVQPQPSSPNKSMETEPSYSAEEEAQLRLALAFNNDRYNFGAPVWSSSSSPPSPQSPQFLHPNVDYASPRNRRHSSPAVHMQVSSDFDYDIPRPPRSAKTRSLNETVVRGDMDSPLPLPPPPLLRPRTFWKNTTRSALSSPAYSPSTHLIRRSTFIAAGLSFDAPIADISALGVETRTLSQGIAVLPSLPV